MKVQSEDLVDDFVEEDEKKEVTIVEDSSEESGKDVEDSSEESYQDEKRRKVEQEKAIEEQDFSFVKPRGYVERRIKLIRPLNVSSTTQITQHKKKRLYIPRVSLSLFQLLTI